MSLGKKDIAKNISAEAQIPLKLSKDVLHTFIDLITTKSKERSIKLSNFGTFYIHKTPKRLGRNPKTKEDFLISERSKLVLKISSRIKKVLN